MSAQASQTQWYLARDGQQFGPLSDTELAKFIELGHLQPTDLLWRAGSPDWRPPLVVFPPRNPAMQRPAPSPRHAAVSPPSCGARAQAMARRGPSARTGPSGRRQNQAHRESYAEPEKAPRRGRGLRRTLVVIVCLGALGAGGWYAYRDNQKLARFLQTLATRVPAGLRDMLAAKS